MRPGEVLRFEGAGRGAALRRLGIAYLVRTSDLPSVVVATVPLGECGKVLLIPHQVSVVREGLHDVHEFLALPRRRLRVQAAKREDR
jgi:hypothetical protein